jgi:hypothetical protein
MSISRSMKNRILSCQARVRSSYVELGSSIYLSSFHLYLRVYLAYAIFCIFICNGAETNSTFTSPRL